jgi:hypothetical protein
MYVVRLSVVRVLSLNIKEYIVVSVRFLARFNKYFSNKDFSKYFSNFPFHSCNCKLFFPVGYFVLYTRV